jgi:hypothetical protein
MSVAAPVFPFARRLTPALFAATMFLSALLVFAVQPMFTKMVLRGLVDHPRSGLLQWWRSRPSFLSATSTPMS